MTTLIKKGPPPFESNKKSKVPLFDTQKKGEKKRKKSVGIKGRSVFYLDKQEHEEEENKKDSAGKQQRRKREREREDQIQDGFCHSQGKREGDTSG